MQMIGRGGKHGIDISRVGNRYGNEMPLIRADISLNHSRHIRSRMDERPAARYIGMNSQAMYVPLVIDLAENPEATAGLNIKGAAGSDGDGLAGY